MKLNNALLVVMAVGLTSAVLWGLSTYKPKPPVKEGSRIARLPVETMVTQAEDFQVLLPSQGLVEAVTRAELAAQIAGSVVTRSRNFDLGGAFSQGDVLLTIDDVDYIAAVKLAESNLNQARVNLEQEQARAAQAIRDWARLGNGQAPNQLVKREPQLEAAQAQLDAAEAELDRAKINLERTRITAPFDGRVLTKRIGMGGYVTPGQILGTIVRANHMRVRLPVSASWRQMLDWSGMESKVEFSLDVDEKPVTWQGQIVRTSAEVSTGSRQFTVVANIDLDSASRADTALFIGDYVTANISGRVLKDVFVVPRKAVYDDEYVWLVQDEAIYKQEVHVAWIDEDNAIIDRGLASGQTLVTTPMGRVITGTPVRIITPLPSADIEVSHMQDAN